MPSVEDLSGQQNVMLTARAAAAPDAAARICAVVPEPCRDRAALELVLHEALANAVMHGCLELASDLRKTLDGHRQFQELFRCRLEDPAYGERIIQIEMNWTPIHVLVHVLDPGPGYVCVDPAEPEAAAKSGRGLMMIRALAEDVRVDMQGRRISFKVVR